MSTSFHRGHHSCRPIIRTTTRHTSLGSLHRSSPLSITLSAPTQSEGHWRELTWQLPGLMKAGQQAATAWNTGQQVWKTARSWMKSWTAGTSTLSETTQPQAHAVLEKDPPGDVPPVPEEEGGHQSAMLEEQEGNAEISEDEDEAPRKPLWGPTRCCISCVSFRRSDPTYSAHLISSLQSTSTQRILKASAKVRGLYSKETASSADDQTICFALIVERPIPVLNGSIGH